MIVRIVRLYKFSNGILCLSIFRDKVLQENRDFYKLWAKSRKNTVRVARLGSTVHNLAFTSLSRAFWLVLAASSVSMNAEALCLRACVRAYVHARAYTSRLAGNRNPIRGNIKTRSAPDALPHRENWEPFTTRTAKDESHTFARHRTNSRSKRERTMRNWLAT